MIRDFSIQQKLYTGFGAILAVLLVLLLSSYKKFADLSEANREDRQILQILVQGNDIHASVLDIQAQFRGFLLTGNPDFVSRLSQKEAALAQQFLHLQPLLEANRIQRERLQQINTLVGNWQRDVIHPLIEKRRVLGNAPGAAGDMGRLLEASRGFRDLSEALELLRTFEDTEAKLLATHLARTTHLREEMFFLLVAGGSAAILAAILIALYLSRAILTPLRGLSATVADISAGKRDARVPVNSRDEFGRLATDFNHMAQALQDTREREQQSADELRSKVDSLLAVVSRATAGDLTGRVTVSGSDAIGQLGEGLGRMFDNLRVLLNRVQKAGIQVTTSTTEIAASARQQEATGVEQAQTSVEVLSTTKEISANSAQLLKTMEEVRQVADYTQVATSDAQGSLVRMDSTMQRMVSATDAINAKLATLSEKASNINNVLTTITKVADQTNILSLNAAIEAEKAGEAGRGFAVVASEIRRLADQTSVATWDIEQMLKEMQSAVSASVMGMDKFSDEIRRSAGEVQQVGGQLSGVIEQVRNLTPRFELVLEGMQSQSVGATQIAETMNQLNEATQQTVDSLKATSEAVQQLQYAAQDLQASVSSFAVTL
ncbi:MAG TPA: methyl-accepting chemotaxis protein [Noviherbaspirillum sp.]